MSPSSLPSAYFFLLLLKSFGPLTASLAFALSIFLQVTTPVLKPRLQHLAILLFDMTCCEAAECFPCAIEGCAVLCLLDLINLRNLISSVCREDVGKLTLSALMTHPGVIIDAL